MTQKISFYLLSTLCLLACSPRNKGESSQVKEAEVASETREQSLGLGLNDVAILMPLNSLPELRKSLPKLLDKASPELYGITNDPYAGQNFVPDWFEEQSTSERINNPSPKMPIVSRKDPKTDTFASLSNEYTLVSLRLDPCTNNLQVASEAECVRELRLVWQILDEDSIEGESLSQRRDGNVHTLYTLTRDEFKSIAKSLQALHKNASVDTTDLPLLPHPVIAKEGLESPYLKGVLAIVNTYARSSKLNEIAVMRIDANADSWTFMHIAVENGEKKDLAIPGSKTFSNEANFVDNVSEIGGGSSTMGTGSESLTHEFVMPSLFMGGRGSRPPSQEEVAAQMIQKLNSRNMVENPTKHNPKNMDCVSCHITDKQDRDYELAKNRGLLPENFPALETFTEHRYTSKWNLERKFPNIQGLTTSVQNFSFLGGRVHSPIIVQRVINDAAETLSFMEKHPEAIEEK